MKKPPLQFLPMAFYNAAVNIRPPANLQQSVTSEEDLPGGFWKLVEKELRHYNENKDRLLNKRGAVKKEHILGGLSANISIRRMTKIIISNRDDEVDHKSIEDLEYLIRVK
ncbi:MAG: hypothetical protein VX346_10300 [Planctomycetota bacterium]|nr:hypothetical protein [Planctomycetota bacterium]